MKCAWQELLSILPRHLQGDTDKLGKGELQEMRLRLGKRPELVLPGGYNYLPGVITMEELRFVVNAASRYSPWAASTVSQGYITAPGGHRIGLCGEVVFEDRQVKSFREVNALCIRIARDFPDLANGIDFSGNMLILGPPGSGKTTMLRSISRKIAGEESTTVVDERGELFPVGFETGRRMDVIRGCDKKQGIDMALRTMGPTTIVVDEITAARDTEALLQAGWCGVRLIATAHAAGIDDLKKRRIYGPLVDTGLFSTVLVMARDKSWRLEKEVA